MIIGRNVSTQIATHAAIAAAHHTATVRRPIAVGSYTGDGNAGRAIAHGLGVVPQLVIIICGHDPNESITIENPEINEVICVHKAAGVSNTGITALNATNFYLGGDAVSGNENTKVYRWFAIG